MNQSREQKFRIAIAVSKDNQAAYKYLGSQLQDTTFKEQVHFVPLTRQALQKETQVDAIITDEASAQLLLQIAHTYPLPFTVLLRSGPRLATTALIISEVVYFQERQHHPFALANVFLNYFQDIREEKEAKANKIWQFTSPLVLS